MTYTRVDAGTGRVKPLTDSEWPDNGQAERYQRKQRRRLRKEVRDLSDKLDKLRAARAPKTMIDKAERTWQAAYKDLAALDVS